MSALNQSMLKAIREACETETLSAGHVKQVLKLALSAARQTKRIAESPKQLHDTWQPSSWESLSNALAASGRFKTSTGLPVLCKQIIQVATQDERSDGKVKASTKRKADAVEETEDVQPSKKVKKKVKKAKA